MPRGSRSRCVSQPALCVASHSIQSLEPRKLLSFSASTLLDSGFVSLQRDGQQDWVKQGQWIVEFEAPGSSLRVGKLNTSLTAQGISSKTLRFSQSLGDKQTFVVKSDPIATLDDVTQSLSGFSGI